MGGALCGHGMRWNVLGMYLKFNVEKRLKCPKCIHLLLYYPWDGSMAYPWTPLEFVNSISGWSPGETVNELTGVTGKKFLIPRLDLKCGFLSRSKGCGTREKMIFVDWSGEWIH